MSMFLSLGIFMCLSVLFFPFNPYVPLYCLRLCLLLCSCLRVCVLALWWCLLALAILRRGWCHFSQWQAVAHAGWPRVSTLIVSGTSLSTTPPTSSTHPPTRTPLPPPTTDHGPYREPSQRNGLGTGCLFERGKRRIVLPVGHGGGTGREIGMQKQNLIGLLLAWIKGWHIFFKINELA